MCEAEKSAIKRQKNAWHDVIGITLNNAVPVAGAVLLGWELPPILFFYWLDGELCILELMGNVMGELSREEEGLFPKSITGIKRIIYYIITLILAGLIASFPAILAGWTIYALLNDHFISPFDSIFAQTAVWIGIGLEIVIRGFRVISGIIKPSQIHVKYIAEEKYTLLAYRFCIMYFLGGFFFKSGGTISLYIFLIFIAALFTYSELRPDRLLHIAGYYAAKQKDLRKQGKKDQS